MKKKMSLEQRAQNYYGHQHQNLKAREELIRRGVKKTAPNLPKMDATFDGMLARVKESDRRTTARRKGR